MLVFGRNLLIFVLLALFGAQANAAQLAENESPTDASIDVTSAATADGADRDQADASLEEASSSDQPCPVAEPRAPEAEHAFVPGIVAVSGDDGSAGNGSPLVDAELEEDALEALPVSGVPQRDLTRSAPTHFGESHRAGVRSGLERPPRS